MTEPRISVICACFNHGKFIHEMLDSVLNQTFKEFEVIIVNDGSTDNTAEILGNIRNEKVKIIHTGNFGPAHARNLAIENAGAQIIMNLDADDKIAPELLEKAFNIINSDTEIGIVYSEAECFGATSGKYDIEDYSPEAMLFDNRIISQAFFRKDDWVTVGGYSGELIYNLEDWDFWLMILELERKVYKIPEKLVWYRTYENALDSRSGKMKKDRLKVLISLVTIYNRHKALYKKHPNAAKHFSRLERKLKNENMVLRLFRDFLYKYFRRL